MSWTADRNMAAELGARHTRYGRTWLYKATVGPDAVLAYLERRGEGWTIVINPAGLSQIERQEELPPGNQLQRTVGVRRPEVGAHQLCA